jgi:glucose-fructose oxidoreductase
MKKIRYAVAGLGHIAQVAVLPAFAQAENSELAALITGEPEKARELSEKYGVLGYPYYGFEDALREQRVDAVFITLPNTMHREYTERAAAVGVHVLCEKPMATTEEDCRAMILACADADVRLMVAYRLHFASAHVRAVELAKDGKLGELRYFNSLFAMQVADDNIRVEREMGGGPLFDIGIYCINAARYLFQDEPLEVSATTAAGDDPRFDEVEEMASVAMRFPGERLASFTCSFGSVDMDQLDLVGTKGALHIEPAYEYAGELKWKLKIEADESERTFPASDQFAAEIIYFSDCILHGRKPEPSGLEGLADVRIIHAILESARDGRTVPVHAVHRDERPSRRQEIRRPPVEKKAETVGTSSPHQP